MLPPLKVEREIQSKFEIACNLININVNYRWKIITEFQEHKRLLVYKVVIGKHEVAKDWVKSS